MDNTQECLETPVFENELVDLIVEKYEEHSPLVEFMKWRDWLERAALLLTEREFEHNALIRKAKKASSEAYEKAAVVVKKSVGKPMASPADLCAIIALQNKSRLEHVEIVAVLCMECIKDLKGDVSRDLDHVINMFSLQSLIHPSLIEGMCVEFQENAELLNQKREKVFKGRMKI